MEKCEFPLQDDGSKKEYDGVALIEDVCEFFENF
jgi:hypothetical protein